MKLSDNPMILIPGAALIGFALVTGPAAIVSLTTGRSIAIFSAAEHRLCDQAVDALLHSTELVEVQRAAAIVHEIPCSIGRRLDHPN